MWPLPCRDRLTTPCWMLPRAAVGMCTYPHSPPPPSLHRHPRPAPLCYASELYNRRSRARPATERATGTHADVLRESARARVLQSFAGPGDRLYILCGGGFIGETVAAFMYERGQKVTALSWLVIGLGWERGGRAGPHGGVRRPAVCVMFCDV